MLFALERWIQKGLAYQLLLMTALIALVAALGGLAAWATTSKFESAPEAMWWAFLRLTDPGYLGDDEGMGLRLISTIVTVLGYVLFMGSLIAIMTQWLALTMRKLESGLTPITMKDHVVILGWTNRTPEIAHKLLGAQGRLQRFLAGHNTKKLRLVILADEVDAERRLEMRDHLGPLWSDNQIFLRSGSSLQPEHLERLDLCRAAVVLIPGSDFELGGAELTDARVVKTLLTLRNLLRTTPVEQRPHVVAEVFDSQKLSLARSTLDGERIEIVTSDHVISRLVSQSVRHRGLAPIMFGLLSHRQGNSLYLRTFPELAGHTPRALSASFPRAIVLGLVRREADGLRTILDPRSAETLRPDDLLVLLAPSYAHCNPADAATRSAPAPGVETPPPAPIAVPDDVRRHRVLVLGWSYKVAGLIAELDEARSERFEVTIMSRADVAERQAMLARVEYSDARVRVAHVCGDYAIEHDLTEANPASFDHVLFMASGWMSCAEEADARTVLGFALLRTLLAGATDAPEVLVELLDPSNAHLFDEEEHGVVLVSPRVLSHVLAHVALRPELSALFDELFGSGGTEFDLRPAADFGLVGREVGFAEIRDLAWQHGLVALGIVMRSGPTRAVHLNPDRTRQWTLVEGDQIVVLWQPMATG